MRKFLLALIAATAAAPLGAATLYISDELMVPLRRGPSNQHRILHAGLPSGMALEVLSEDRAAGFTHVRTPNGLEGWLPTQYLVAQPPARDRLAAANRRIESLETQLKSLRETYQETRGERSEVESRAAALEKQTQKLQAELAEIRRASATAIAQYEENKRLKADNQSLGAQVTQLTGRVRELERNVTLKWLLAGGGLILAGLVLGVIIKSRPKRSVWA